MILLLYCAFLFHFVWILASRAGLATPSLWRRASLFVRRTGNGIDFPKRSASANVPGGTRCRLARHCARRFCLPFGGGETGLFGGGDNNGVAPRANPPPFSGAILYYEYGPNYAPSFPEGAAIGAADGYGNNCFVRIISQILSGDRSAGADRAIRARFASVRDALVAKYGCGPVAELELQVRRHLIVEEIGGEP